ncbi:MAG: type II toxin-antitoxin system HicA family toxin [Gammaproteobacteria bacterium]|nr:type II toxin-antitoxin system HicA family toxin [Gammaproteobacteria bacterium]
MSAKHRRTLARIHQKPTPADFKWQELISALEHYGVEVVEREGSRVGLRLGDERTVVHRPHPRSVTGRATVRVIVDFLKAAGVIPLQEETKPR